MSGVRDVTEITFSSEEMASALTQAALWVQQHAGEMAVETIVGDSEYVMVYYTEDKVPAQPDRGAIFGSRVYGPGDDFQLGGHVGYSLKGSRA